jgi:hypothetical protein
VVSRDVRDRDLLAKQTPPVAISSSRRADNIVTTKEKLGNAEVDKTTIKGKGTPAGLQKAIIEFCSQ